jgi:hypothetical protein
VSLDDVAYGQDGFLPDFVKMDIEGGEFDALLGAERLLSERVPGLIVEVHSLEIEKQCGRFLQALGYKPIVVSPRRWLRDNRPTGHNRWLVAPGRDSRGELDPVQHEHLEDDPSDA